MSAVVKDIFFLKQYLVKFCFALDNISCFPKTKKEAITYSHGRWHYTCENTLQIILGIAIMMTKLFSLDCQQKTFRGILSYTFYCNRNNDSLGKAAIKLNGKMSFRLISVVVIFTLLQSLEKTGNLLYFAGNLISLGHWD